jgi:hypothetical protein
MTLSGTLSVHSKRNTCEKISPVLENFSVGRPEARSNLIIAPTSCARAVELPSPIVIAAIAMHTQIMQNLILFCFISLLDAVRFAFPREFVAIPVAS